MFECAAARRLASAILVFTLGTSPAAAQALIDDRQLTIQAPEDVTARRQALIEYLWGAAGMPVALPSLVERDDLSPVPLANLGRIDTLVVTMEGGRRGYAHHLMPPSPGNRLIVFPLGHAQTFRDYPPAIPGVDLGVQRAIDALLGARFSVLVVYMPGEASFQTRLAVSDVGGHQDIFLAPVSQGSPMKFFIEPIAVSLNYLRTGSAEGGFPLYQQIDMVGLSGGGWATTLYAAVDPSVITSVQVAGSLPLYLRDPIEGDVEQLHPEFYQRFGYLDLYALASAGTGRLHLQILNRFDTAAFGQYAVRPSPQTFDADVRAYESRVVNALVSTGMGQFRLVIDEAAREHQISLWALGTEVLPSLSPAVGLASDRSLPLSAGLPVTWTAGVPAPGGPHDVAFWLYESQAGWRLVQGYGPQAAWTWTPFSEGTYAVQAWVRRRGTSLPYQGYASSNYITVGPPLAITIDSLTRTPASDITAGTSMAWTASARGSALLEYEFTATDASGIGTVLQPFGPAPLLTWTPVAPGTYTIAVRVRHGGRPAASAVERRASPVTVRPAALTTVRLGADQPLPLSAGRPTRWTATAATSQAVEVAFWLYDPAAGWALARPYGADRTWLWTPPAVGAYVVQAWVRRAGSAAPYEAWASTNFFDVTTQPLRVLSLDTSLQVPTTRLPLTWSIRTAGGNGTPEYKFWLYDAATGAWRTLQDWSPSPSATWTPQPSDFGIHALQVWARRAGSGAAYETYVAPGYFLVTP